MIHEPKILPTLAAVNKPSAESCCVAKKPNNMASDCMGNKVAANNALPNKIRYDKNVYRILR